MNDAFETGMAVVKDIKERQVPVSESHGGKDDIIALLREKGGFRLL